MNSLFACVRSCPVSDPSHTQSCTQYRASWTVTIPSTCTDGGDLRVSLSGCYATSSIEKWGVVTNHNQRAAAYRQDSDEVCSDVQDISYRGQPGEIAIRVERARNDLSKVRRFKYQLTPPTFIQRTLGIPIPLLNACGT